MEYSLLSCDSSILGYTEHRSCAWLNFIHLLVRNKNIPVINNSRKWAQIASVHLFSLRVSRKSFRQGDDSVGWGSAQPSTPWVFPGRHFHISEPQPPFFLLFMCMYMYWTCLHESVYVRDYPLSLLRHIHWGGVSQPNLKLPHMAGLHSQLAPVVPSPPSEAGVTGRLSWHLHGFWGPSSCLSANIIASPHLEGQQETLESKELS